MNTNFEVIGLTRLKESNPILEVDVSRYRRIRCEEMCGRRLGNVRKCVGVWGKVLGCGWRCGEV